MPGPPATVTLNAGGAYFETTPATLRSAPGYLRNLLAGRQGVQLSDGGSYFIDRSSQQFDRILNFLRGVPLHLELLPKAELAALKEEAAFYRLEALVAAVTAVTDAQKPPLPPAFAQGMNYALTDEGTVATKTGAEGWNATLFVRIVRSADSGLMIGVAPAAIDQSASHNHARGRYLHALDGSFFACGASFPYHFTCAPTGAGGRDGWDHQGVTIRAGSVVGVELDINRYLFFSVDGVDVKGGQPACVLPPRCPSVRLAVVMKDAGDAVKILPNELLAVRRRAPRG
ncbi:BTB/POZ protein [Tribonema minus]|uniref:BTB/POZ protein n=1 Tax=Tribonema minus TaxID=303371 RepID=A0A836CMI3_9STRA|nr:BTB/POZ protein [Tribonema minus]